VSIEPRVVAVIPQELPSGKGVAKGGWEAGGTWSERSSNWKQRASERSPALRTKAQTF